MSDWNAFFTDTGSLIEWQGDSRFARTARDSHQLYYGTLVISSMNRGRTAAVFWLHNKRNPEQRFPVRMNEMLKMLTAKGCFVQYGEITGTFKVVKQGANYSLSFVQPQPAGNAFDFESVAPVEAT